VRPRVRPAPLASVVAVGALLVGCSSGPSQEQRIADAITAYDTVTDRAVGLDGRVQGLYPDLDLRFAEASLGTGRWSACTSEPYDNTYDSPEASTWLNGNVYVVEPRQSTTWLIEPLAQTYVEDGWTLSVDHLDSNLPEMVLRKDGYRLIIRGLTQEYIDRYPDDSARFTVIFYSPCLYSPDNLTEWDRTDPHDFDLAPPGQEAP
jgi:hypothetical protein